MAIPPFYRSRSVYHFLTITNFPGVLEHGLLAKNELQRRRLPAVSIAYDTIQSRRSRMRVPCGPRGVVHDYVPFYFCRRSPMLHAVVEQGYAEQRDIIYLRCPITLLDQYHCVFTNASANTNVAPQFFEQPNDLDAIDWDAVETWRWSSKYDAPGELPVRQAKQAELLVHRRVDPSAIAEIVVWNEDVAERVRGMYAQRNMQPPPISFGFTEYYFLNDDGTSSIAVQASDHRRGLEDRTETEDDFMFWDAVTSLPPDSDSDFAALISAYEVEIEGTAALQEPEISESFPTHSAPLAHSLSEDFNPQPPVRMLQSERMYELHTPHPYEEVLYRRCHETTRYVKEHLNQGRTPRYRFLVHLMQALRNDFGCLPETRALRGLHIQVGEHRMNVDEHTRCVVAALVQQASYVALSPGDKVIVEVAAQLHGIGYGVRTVGRPDEWPEHMATLQGLVLVQRILTQEITDLKSMSARLIPRLVCYHDLLGGIIAGQRRIDELVRASASRETLDLLILLGTAKMVGTDPTWKQYNASAVEFIRRRAAAKL
ncbi:MAG: DUF4433 domain-containing protein [Chloroflexota bacterium]|nr:DUF4433 domain-containing protein [Chloroflexota bacterium]